LIQNCGVVPNAWAGWGLEASRQLQKVPQVMIAFEERLVVHDPLWQKPDRHDELSAQAAPTPSSGAHVCVDGSQKAAESHGICGLVHAAPIANRAAQIWPLQYAVERQLSELLHAAPIATRALQIGGRLRSQYAVETQCLPPVHGLPTGYDAAQILVWRSQITPWLRSQR
jgi:hypothetical protein